MKKITSFLIKLIYCVVIVALIEPTYFVRTPLHDMLGPVRYAAFAISIVMIFYCRLYKDKTFWWLLAFFCWLTLSTLIYSHKLSDSFLYNTRLMFSVFVFASCGARKFPKFFVGSFAGIYSLWILLQGITWKPNGLYLNSNGQFTFFLGTKTFFTYYFIPALLFVLVFMEICKLNKPFYSRLFAAFTAVGAFLYLTRQPISTAILCAALLALGIFVTEKFPSAGKKIMKYGFIVTLIICVLFIYNIVQEMFSFIIVDMLNESLELNGRTQIWEQVLNYIYKKPLLGYGYSSGIKFDAWQEYNTSAHNFYLFLVFSGGLTGLGIFLGAIYSAHKKLFKRINYRLTRFIILTFIVINVECITEVCCFNAMYFSVLALAANIDYILPNRKRKPINLDLDFSLAE